MARPKIARSATVTKHVKKRAITDMANMFAALELDEPYEYFPLLKLPRELRDDILDYVASLVESEDSGGLGSWAIPVIDIRVKKTSVEQRLQLWPYEGWSTDHFQGPLAMPTVSKQIRHEWQEAVSRTVPHHARVNLIHFSNTGKTITFHHELLAFFPTTMRRLCIQNITRKGFCYLDERQKQSELLKETGLIALSKYLNSCTKLAELVIDCCAADGHGQRGWSIPHALGSDLLLEALVKIVESLPCVREYTMLTCSQTAHAVRRKDKLQRNENLIEERPADLCSSEAYGFLHSMGVIA